MRSGVTAVTPLGVCFKTNPSGVTAVTPGRIENLHASPISDPTRHAPAALSIPRYAPAMRKMKKMIRIATIA